MSNSRDIHHGWRYRRWKRAVKASGGNKCSTCGATTNLTADHIKPVATHPELRYDVSNGRTLCQDCRIKDMLEGQSKGLFKRR